MAKISINPTDRVFVLTGAGISAESGLPTFRASDGLWAGHRIEEVCTPEALEADPWLVWQFYSMRRADCAKAQPNAAHIALAELETQLGDRFFLCTQNVDDLHERAGSRRWCTCTVNWPNRAAKTSAADRLWRIVLFIAAWTTCPVAPAAPVCARTSAFSAKCRTTCRGSSARSPRLR